MLDTPEAVFEALRENNERPYGRPRTVVAEELVEAAEQFEDKGSLVTALLELMEAYSYSGEHRKTPVVFARILKVRESDPDAFSEWEADQILWRFKWVANSLIQVPDVPLAAIRRWIDEARDRYRAAGHGPHPVYALRYQLAAHTGVDVLSSFDLWVTRPRSALSDCEACEVRRRACHLVRTGEDGRALTAWQPVLSGALTCTEEPYGSQAFSLLPLLRLGRTDEARSHHLVGYRYARGRTGMAEEVGLHVEFCALSRNEGRGLEILAENRVLFEDGGAPLARLAFLTAVELLLAGLVADGHDDLAVAGPPGSNWTATTLLERVRSDAGSIAAAFDTRNGTTAVSEGRRTRLAQRPLVAEPLVLGIRATLPGGQGAPAAPPVLASAERIPEDFTALVTRARELTQVGRPDDDTLWQRVAEVVAAEGHLHPAELGPEEHLRAELAEHAGFAAFTDEKWQLGRQVMLEAAATYEKAGLPAHAAAARARAATGLATAAHKDPEVDGSSVGEELDAALLRTRELTADTTGSPAGTPSRAADELADKYLVVLQSRVTIAHTALINELPDISDATRRAFDAALAEFRAEATRLDRAHRLATAHQFAADVAARTDDLDTAADEVNAALQLAEKSLQPWRATRLLGLLGQITLQSGHPDQAVPLLHRALASAAQWGDRSFPVSSTYALLGHACAHSGDLQGAIRHLSEAADRLDREAEVENAAQVRLELASLLADANRQADAVAVLESVLNSEADALDERLRAQLRLNLARGLSALDEKRAAAEEFLRLADSLADWPDQDTHTMVACEAAVALAEADLWDPARAAYARALASHATAPRPGRVAGMMCEFARLTMAARDAEGLDAALGHLAEADLVCEQAADDAEDLVAWYQAGTIRYQRARAYATAARYAEALAEMERAITAYEAGGRPAEEPRAEAVRVAALIEGNALGAVDAAAARLSLAIARCTEADLPQAASALASLRQGLLSQQNA
ncbi:hypothetical protein [Streptomyces sp. H39-S7]|uniref:hypothetical protein n=1 Tax=Streptomyces sp. H39-S7 TaxID=3004357 RepID=UPI0022AE5828|nr:hypothetical protein [Streptomyces sp. H39-S7]MCZ4120973.1 hypothetical protein [Streptomyces sp. H39-S7]